MQKARLKAAAGFISDLCWFFTWVMPHLFLCSLVIFWKGSMGW